VLISFIGELKKDLRKKLRFFYSCGGLLINGIFQKFYIPFSKRKFYNAENYIRAMINSSAEIQPHCLSASFVQSTKHRLLYVVLQNAKLLEKTFFGSCCFLQKVFI